MENRLLTVQEFLRLANNFYNSAGLGVDLQRMSVDLNLLNYVLSHAPDVKKKYKVALCCICINPPYWQYIKPMIDGARQYFLPGHDVDFFVWSDIKDDKETIQKAMDHTVQITLAVNDPSRHQLLVEEITQSYKFLQDHYKELGAKEIFPLEPIEWPMPTLMRYHTMLQQEEKLAEYDFVFYVDVDMAFVNIVGDEILGKRLTAVQQPMYAIRKEWWPPYEPNEKSAAYIPRLGKVVNDNGKPRFMPLYLAGGFQGGTSAAFIAAMKEMKKMVDHDLNMNYIPVWNDESIWNAYLFKNPSDDDVILTPSYTYPDSLIKEYFEPAWGCGYHPKLMTLTKKFSFQPGAGEHLQKVLSETQKLQP